MKTATITEIINQNIDIVYKTVTNNFDYKWRGIEKITHLNDTFFIEYYPNGKSTEFKIVQKISNRLYAFDMENKIYIGTWIAKFYKVDEDHTKVEFTEYRYIKNPVTHALSYLFTNLHKIQKKYIENLNLKLKKIK